MQVLQFVMETPRVTRVVVVRGRRARVSVSVSPLNSVTLSMGTYSRPVASHAILDSI